MAETVRVIRSSRRTVSMELRPNGELLVRAPYFVTNREIQHFVQGNKAWIERKKAKLQNRAPDEASADILSDEELKKLSEEAKRVLSEKAHRYAGRIGVTFGRISIRHQRTKWGSCSSKGNLNFNCLLMLAPDEVQNYVVIHELCHRKQMNHSPQFWAEVERVMPDYRIQKKWLRDHGNELMRRNPKQ